MLVVRYIGRSFFSRNEEHLHRLKEENYVSSNFVETEQEPHPYFSLQDITGPHRSLSSEGEGEGHTPVMI